MNNLAQTQTFTCPACNITYTTTQDEAETQEEFKKCFPGEIEAVKVCESCAAQYYAWVAQKGVSKA